MSIVPSALGVPIFLPTSFSMSATNLGSRNFAGVNLSPSKFFLKELLSASKL